jgi:hypothetical protein
VQADDQCFHGLPFVGGRRTRRADVEWYAHDDTEAASPQCPLCGNRFPQWHQEEPSLRILSLYHITWFGIRKLTAGQGRPKGGSEGTGLSPTRIADLTASYCPGRVERQNNSLSCFLPQGTTASSLTILIGNSCAGGIFGSTINFLCTLDVGRNRAEKGP